MKLPQEPITSTIILMPWPKKPPLNLNRRAHWSEIATVRQTAAWMAKTKKLPQGLPHVWVELIYRAPDRRRRDEDNLVATLKPVCDGLVDHGLVQDDHTGLMTKFMPTILPPDSPEYPTIPSGATAMVVTWETHTTPQE